MAKLPGFIGPANPLRATVADVEVTRNWLIEPVDPGLGDPYLRPTPGIEPFVVLADGPIRGEFSQDGRAFAVGSTGFYEVLATHTYIYRGAVALDSRPVRMSSNGSGGNQIGFSSGGYGYIFSLTANTLTQITDPEFPFPCSMMDFCDGYFLALKGGTNQFQWSSLEDGLTWNGLDVAQLSQSSDNLQSLNVVHGQVVLLGTKTSVVWTDTGGSSAFEPIPGSLGMQGSAAPWSAAVLDNTLFWVGGNDIGNGVVFRLDGYTPKRISTHAVESALQSCYRLSDVIAWTCEFDGHLIYALYIPSCEVQWCYDQATGSWFQWAYQDTILMRPVPFVARCHTFAFGQHLIGDRQSSAIYRMDPSICPSELVQMGAA